MEILLKIKTSSAEETENVGFEFAKKLAPGDCIAMKGDLGAGKTAFVRGMAKLLCPGTRVQSPTYTIVNSYRGKIPLYHFDMYRVSGWEDLYSTGFFDYLEQGGVIAAEWSENIENALPENTITVTFDRLGDEKREIIIDGIELKNK